MPSFIIMLQNIINSEKKSCFVVFYISGSLTLIQLLKAAWSNFFAIRVSNNSPHKPITLQNYRLMPIYTSTISLLSKLKHSNLIK